MMTAVGDDDSRRQTLLACAGVFNKTIPSMPNDCFSLGMIGEAITHQVTLSNKKFMES
jgi:hypothetical protein